MGSGEQLRTSVVGDSNCCCLVAEEPCLRRWSPLPLVLTGGTQRGEEDNWAYVLSLGVAYFIIFRSGGLVLEGRGS